MWIEKKSVCNFEGEKKNQSSQTKFFDCAAAPLPLIFWSN